MRLKRLARDKRSSLLWKSRNYGRNKFYNRGPWAEMAGFDKHKSSKQFWLFNFKLVNLNLGNLRLFNNLRLSKPRLEKPR
jgi:hypothetical protein